MTDQNFEPSVDLLKEKLAHAHTKVILAQASLALAQSNGALAQYHLAGAQQLAAELAGKVQQAQQATKKEAPETPTPAAV